MSTTFSSKTTFQLYSLEYGHLEIPHQGIEGGVVATTLKDDFTLEAIYTGVVNAQVETIKVTYLCPVIQFLKETGVFDASENRAKDCLWQMTDWEFVEQQKTDSLNAFVVKLDIAAGEYEKGATSLVRARNKQEAVKIAIEDEAHNELEFNDDGTRATESDGSFVYTARYITKISDAEAKVLSKHL